PNPQRLSIRHGLTEDLVLEGECKADFDALLDSIEAEHQPTTPTEVVMVRRIAMATWRLRRAYHFESGFFLIRRLDLKDHFKDYRNLATGYKQAYIVLDDTRRSNTLDHISRYEARLERSLDRAIRELQRLRSAAYNKLHIQSQFAGPAPEPDPPAPSTPPAAAPDDPVRTTPNQQLALGNKPALSYTLDTFIRRDSMRQLVPVGAGFLVLAATLLWAADDQPRKAQVEPMSQDRFSEIH